MGHLDQIADVSLVHDPGGHAQGQEHSGVLPGDAAFALQAAAGLGDGVHGLPIYFLRLFVFRHQGRRGVGEVLIVDVAGAGLEPGGRAADVGVPFPDDPGGVAVYNHLYIDVLQNPVMAGADAVQAPFVVFLFIINVSSPADAGAPAHEGYGVFGGFFQDCNHVLFFSFAGDSPLLFVLTALQGTVFRMQDPSTRQRPACARTSSTYPAPRPPAPGSGTPNRTFHRRSHGR